jgi:hypothetical protein
MRKTAAQEARSLTERSPIRQRTEINPETRVPHIEQPETTVPQDFGIDPWAVEYEPNPVLFAHLAEPSGTQASKSPIRSHYDNKHYEIPAWLRKVREVRMVGAQSASDPYIAEDLHMTADLIESTVNFQSMESWSSEDTA